MLWPNFLYWTFDVDNVESPLQISILALFVQLKYRFPNLVVGILTRDSVRKALSNGITAAQITHYLRTHAHPQMKALVRLVKLKDAWISILLIDMIFYMFIYNEDLTGF